MSSCAFFGHRNFDYEPYKDKIREIVIDLIERGVTEFYCGGRGDFDGTCARIVWELKKEYPQIKSILVLSYMPGKEFLLPSFYDESVYLLEKSVPWRFAINRTNRKLVETVQYVISGARGYGGARTVCDYAERLHKTMFYVVDDLATHDYNRALADWQEKMQDEEYKKHYEEEIAKLVEQTKPILGEQMAKRAKKRKGKN